MLESFANFFADNIWLAVILIAIIPALEGRVAIPFALSGALLGTNTLPWHWTLLCAFIGSIIPALPVIFLTRKIKNRFFTGFVQEKYNSKITKLTLQSSNIKKLVWLAAFVAIPLPMTGVWSGSLIAGLTKLSPWKSFIAISIGSLVACSIIILICLFFEGSELIVLLASIAILAIFVLFEVVKAVIKKIKKERSG